jgi:hypothetical protein
MTLPACSTTGHTRTYDVLDLVDISLLNSKYVVDSSDSSVGTAARSQEIDSNSMGGDQIPSIVGQCIDSSSHAQTSLNLSRLHSVSPQLDRHLSYGNFVDITVERVSPLGM